MDSHRRVCSSFSTDQNSHQLELTTVWSFPDRGDWATHRGDYPGNWAPQVPRNLILRYSQPHDIVLDPFVGSGTTLIECKLLDRSGIGVDINPNAVEISKARLGFATENQSEQAVIMGDARQLQFAPDCVDLICTHPPYADAIRYSRGIAGDLSNITDVDLFAKEMAYVAHEFLRVLKPRHTCALQIGDIRRRRHIIPLGFLTLSAFLNAGFILQEIVIKIQHNCSSMDYWVERAASKAFLLIAHEYIFVLEKII